MSLDKLIAAATDYFSTGAEVHRRALAGGGGKITDMSGRVAPNDPPVGTVTDGAPKKVAPNDPPVGTVSDDALKKVAAKVTKKEAADEKVIKEAAAEAKPSVAAHREFVAEGSGSYPGVAHTDPKNAASDDLDGPTISYEEDIRPVLRAKSLANRDALVALLGKFNVKSGQELTVDQYPAFLAGLKAI